MNYLAAVRTIAILRHISIAEVVPVAEALAESGVDVVEVTLNTDGALIMIEKIAQLDLGKTLIGAGTVIRAEDVRRIVDAGGKIAISPNTDADVIRASKQAGLISLPGCLTPSEAFAALSAGADGLKVFPCEIVSPAALKALKAVLPKDVPIFAVGGIALDNVAAYREAGAQGAGIGSAIYVPEKPVDRVLTDASAFVAASQD